MFLLLINSDKSATLAHHHSLHFLKVTCLLKLTFEPIIRVLDNVRRNRQIDRVRGQMANDIGRNESTHARNWVAPIFHHSRAIYLKYEQSL